MRGKRMLRKIALLALCATLTLHGFGWLSAAYAAGAGQTVYTFGNVNGPFRDLAKEHEEETKQREKERKKAERKQAMREKKAMKKAEREARERREEGKGREEERGERSKSNMSTGNSGLFKVTAGAAADEADAPL